MKNPEKSALLNFLIALAVISCNVTVFFLNFVSLTKFVTMFYHCDGYLLRGVPVKSLLSKWHHYVKCQA